MSHSRSWRRVVAGGIVAGVALAGLAAPTVASQARGTGNGVEVTPDLTMVQANIKTGMPVPKFQDDVRRVLATRPDFVSYNEVMFRNDAVMAPAGYDIYRSMKNRFTAETAVAWRSDRWTAVNQGTYMISNHRGKPPGKLVELGRRYANWVTLQGTDGRVLSVVSMHVAPLVKGMPDLLVPSVKRLGGLVDQLSAAGPVLVGGDFNVNYRSGRYPRDLLTSYDLVPTYDSLGTVFPTGDHQGATIDFLFDRGTTVLAPDEHHPVELHSDHDAVVAGYEWQVDLPTQTQVVNSDPTGDNTARRTVVAGLIKAISRTQPGGTVAVVTTYFDSRGLTVALRRAAARGVHVQVTKIGRVASPRQQRLGAVLAADADPASWVRACTGTCHDAWVADHLKPSLMMVSAANGSWTTRYDANRSFSAAMVDKPARLWIHTGPVTVNEGGQVLRSLR